MSDRLRFPYYSAMGKAVFFASLVYMLINSAVYVFHLLFVEQRLIQTTTRDFSTTYGYKDFNFYYNNEIVGIEAFSLWGYLIFFGLLLLFYTRFTRTLRHQKAVDHTNTSPSSQLQ